MNSRTMNKETEEFMLWFAYHISQNFLDKSVADTDNRIISMSWLQENYVSNTD